MNYPVLRFKSEYIGPICRGEKRQTRRLEKPGDYTWVCGYIVRPGEPLAYSQICREDGSVRFERDAIYRVPDDASPDDAAVFIRILNMWHERDVREISAEDALAEGFETPADFIAAWTDIYGTQYNGWAIEFEALVCGCGDHIDPEQPGGLAYDERGRPLCWICQSI